MSAIEDQQDAMKVIDGDTRAFEGIVRRWQGPLINLAYRFCRDRGRAEEMAQEAFLRAFRNLLPPGGRSRRSRRGSSPLATNLYCSGDTSDSARDAARRSTKFSEPEDPRDLGSDLARQNQSAAVRKVIQTLPAKYREVLTLYYFHEMDVPSTARSLGLPEGTVKAHLFRARNLLRDKLRPMLASPAASETRPAGGPRRPTKQGSSLPTTELL